MEACWLPHPVQAQASLARVRGGAQITNNQDNFNVGNTTKERTNEDKAQSFSSPSLQ